MLSVRQYKRIAEPCDKILVPAVDVMWPLMTYYYIRCLYIFQNPIHVWHSFRTTRALSLVFRVAYLSLAQAGFKVHFIISMFQGLPLHGRTFGCTNKTVLVVTQSKHNSNSITNCVTFTFRFRSTFFLLFKIKHTQAQLSNLNYSKNQKQKWAYRRNIDKAPVSRAPVLVPDTLLDQIFFWTCCRPQRPDSS